MISYNFRIATRRLFGDSSFETYPGSSSIGTVEIILQRSSILSRTVLGSHCLEPADSLLFWSWVLVITGSEQLHEWPPSLMGLGCERTVLFCKRQKIQQKLPRSRSWNLAVYRQYWQVVIKNLRGSDLRSRSECIVWLKTFVFYLSVRVWVCLASCDLDLDWAKQWWLYRNTRYLEGMGKR